MWKHLLAGDCMCILPGTGPAFFLFEDTQLLEPVGKGFKAAILTVVEDI